MLLVGTTAAGRRQESLARVRRLRAVIVAELLTAAAADGDHGGTAGASARVQIGQRAGADALVGVMRGLELDLLLRISRPDLGHMVHVATPMLHVLLSASDGELLMGTEDSGLLLRLGSHG